MNEITDAFGYWLAGFTDGEGSFLIGKRNGRGPYASYRCGFQIKLRDDDRAILSKIRNILGIGKIYNSSARICGSHVHRPTVDFHVYSFNECAQLVKVFEKYPLRAKKQNDFAVWKLAVAELQKPLDCRDADLLEYYFQKIKRVRQYEAADALPKPKKIELQLGIEFYGNGSSPA